MYVRTWYVYTFVICKSSYLLVIVILKRKVEWMYRLIRVFPGYTSLSVGSVVRWLICNCDTEGKHANIYYIGVQGYVFLLRYSSFFQRGLSVKEDRLEVFNVILLENGLFFYTSLRVDFVVR